MAWLGFVGACGPDGRVKLGSAPEPEPGPPPAEGTPDWVPAGTNAPPEVGEQGELVAYVGSSLTRADTTGYRELGGRRFESWNSGGCSIDQYLDPDSACWREYDRAVDGRPVGAGLLHICILGVETTTYDDVRTVLDTFEQRLPAGAPIYTMGLAHYQPADLCGLAGDVIPDVTRAYADQLAADGLAIRAPDLGPLTDDLTLDGCHPDEEGRRRTGQQLLDFFGP